MGLSTKPGTLRVSRDVNHFRNLKVGAKLSLGFGILLALILCSSALAIYQSTQIGKQMAVMRTNNQKMSLLYAMRLANSTNQLNMRDLLLASDEDLAVANAQIEQTRKAYQASWEQLDAIPHDAEGTRAKQAILASQGAARAMNDQIRALAAAGDRAGATALLYGPAEPLLEARAKAIAAAQKERDGLAGRLNNPSFVERAKPEAVEKARADHAEKSAEADRLAAALARLG